MMQIKPSLHYGRISAKALAPFLIGKKILILSSKTVLQTSYLKGVIDELVNNYEVKVYTHVQPNAPFSDLQKIITDYEVHKPDTIIAIGGGSVIDACKALSVSFEGISLNDLFYKKSKMPASSIQLISIPTTAGTGAELSFGAIIYDDHHNVKGGIRGEVIQSNAVFIDADLYLTAPKKLFAEVGFDCLTHAVETYISLKSNGLAKYQSVAAIKTVLEFLPQAIEGEHKAVQNMTIASAMMGINLAYSSTCLPHRIQYIIGPLTNTSHAQGLIALYKGWVPLLGDNKSLSGLLDLENDLGKNYDLIKEINKLKEQLNLDYSISDLGVSSDQIEFIAQNTTGSVANDPCYKSTNTIIEILEKSL